MCVWCCHRLPILNVDVSVEYVSVSDDQLVLVATIAYLPLTLTSVLSMSVLVTTNLYLLLPSPTYRKRWRRCWRFQCLWRPTCFMVAFPTYKCTLNVDLNIGSVKVNDDLRVFDGSVAYLPWTLTSILAASVLVTTNVYVMVGSPVSLTSCTLRPSNGTRYVVLVAAAKTCTLRWHV